MNHDKPKYLAELPKEQPGLYVIVAIAAVLAVALFGGWTLYVETVQGWERRFNTPAPTTTPAARQGVYAAAARDAHVAEEKLRQLSEQRAKATAYDKCVNGTAFRRLPDGGWENIPDVRC